MSSIPPGLSLCLHQCLQATWGCRTPWAGPLAGLQPSPGAPACAVRLCGCAPAGLAYQCLLRPPLGPPLPHPTDTYTRGAPCSPHNPPKRPPPCLLTHRPLMCTPRFTPHATPSTAAPQVLGTGDERPADFSYHEYLRTSKFCVSAYGHGWGACCPLRAPAIAGALPAVRCALGACTWHSNDGPLQAALGSAPQGVWRGGFRMAWLCMAPVPARQHLLRTLCTGGHAPPPPPCRHPHGADYVEWLRARDCAGAEPACTGAHCICLRNLPALRWPGPAGLLVVLGRLGWVSVEPQKRCSQQGQPITLPASGACHPVTRGGAALRGLLHPVSPPDPSDALRTPLLVCRQREGTAVEFHEASLLPPGTPSPLSLPGVTTAGC